MTSPGPGRRTTGSANTAVSEAMITSHYWGRNDADLAFSRRSAAVVFGRPGGHPSVVAVVDLLDNLVSDVVPAAQW